MKTLLLALGLTLTQASIGSTNIEIDRAWMRISDPLIMSTTFNYEFAALPLKGQVTDSHKYWSSDYWSRRKGGINYRWYSSRPTGFNLKSPTKEQAAQLSQAELSALAPSEKWDLFIGRYDYPTKNEVAAYASPTRPSWEGICDGWAGAALNFDEPEPVTMTNPDGIQIPFGSSDIKGLLSWYYAKKFTDGYDQMGSRCNGTNTTPICQNDMNPGAFHIVLANKIGRDGSTFIADIDRAHEVWNHIAYDFNSIVRYKNLAPRSTSAPGTVKVMRVRTVVHYVYLISRNSWTPVLGTSKQKVTSRTYEYYLDINNQGRIIGGDWISSQRPDFLWLSRKAVSFGGLFKRLPELLNQPVVDEVPEIAVEQ